MTKSKPKPKVKKPVSRAEQAKDMLSLKNVVKPSKTNMVQEMRDRKKRD